MNVTLWVVHCLLYFRPAMTRATPTTPSASTIKTHKVQPTILRSFRIGSVDHNRTSCAMSWYGCISGVHQIYDAWLGEMR